MARIRAAVIGAGSMGRHHARILRSFPDVELVGVVDPAGLPHAFGDVAHLGALDELPDLDFAVVATPTVTHSDVASRLIDRGVHVLVEKPLARSVEEARALVGLAESAGTVLGVGHVERFNPAISLVSRLVTEPLFMAFERLSPYTPRISDSVVFDLMVHDLDLACWLAGECPSSAQAVGARIVSDSLDVCSAVLRFPSGCIASVQASRVTQDKVRRVAVSERERFIVADSVRQDVSVKREVAVEFAEDAAGQAYREASVVEIPYLDRSGEPLARELRDFIEAVAGEHAPLVDGAAGLRAVELADRVEAAAVRSMAGGPDDE